jgi:HPt (histidine-containing phosphotransfer) domain-containing protein
MNDSNAAGGDAAAMVIDMKHVIEDLQIDEEGYFELVGVFLDEVAPIRESIARALDSGREPFIRVCHELGTTLGVVGANRGRLLARGLERSLRAGEPVDLPMAAAALLRELDVVAQILRSARG